MSSLGSAATGEAEKLRSLEGMRFFGAFSIFLFHASAAQTAFELKGDRVSYAGLNALPDLLESYVRHSDNFADFFFLLSGFILAYVYWRPDGSFAATPSEFLVKRLSRIYPPHLLVLVLIIPLNAPFLLMNMEAGVYKLHSVVASWGMTALLLHAWTPSLIWYWNVTAWALAALLFFYVLTPWLLPILARLKRWAMLALLIAAPFIAVAPSVVAERFFPDNTSFGVFVDYAPIFVLIHFVAGILTARLMGVSRFTPTPARANSGLSWGDAAFVLIIAVRATADVLPLAEVLRSDLVMLPLYLVVLRDLALGRGAVARFFSLALFAHLGKWAFPVYVWQTFLFSLSFFLSFYFESLRPWVLWMTVLSILPIAAASTYFVEKPVGAFLQRRATKLLARGARPS